MGADLRNVKRKFSALMKEVSAVTSSQFVIWLDEKVAEFKVNGSMKLDTQADPPKWLKDYSLSMMISGATMRSSSKAHTQQIVQQRNTTTVVKKGNNNTNISNLSKNNANMKFKSGLTIASYKNNKKIIGNASNFTAVRNGKSNIIRQDLPAINGVTMAPVRKRKLLTPSQRISGFDAMVNSALGTTNKISGQNIEDYDELMSDGKHSSGYPLTGEDGMICDPPTCPKVQKKDRNYTVVPNRIIKGNISSVSLNIPKIQTSSSRRKPNNTVRNQTLLRQVLEMSPVKPEDIEMNLSDPVVKPVSQNTNIYACGWHTNGDASAEADTTEANNEPSSSATTIEAVDSTADLSYSGATTIEASESSSSAVTLEASDSTAEQSSSDLLDTGDIVFPNMSDLELSISTPSSESGASELGNEATVDISNDVVIENAEDGTTVNFSEVKVESPMEDEDDNSHDSVISCDPADSSALSYGVTNDSIVESELIKSEADDVTGDVDKCADDVKPAALNRLPVRNHNHAGQTKPVDKRSNLESLLQKRFSKIVPSNTNHKTSPDVTVETKPQSKTVKPLKILMKRKVVTAKSVNGQSKQSSLITKSVKVVLKSAAKSSKLTPLLKSASIRHESSNDSSGSSKKVSSTFVSGAESSIVFCMFCKETHVLSDIRFHISEEHIHDYFDVVTEMYECPECGSSVQARSNFLRHCIAHMTTSRQMFQCDVCSRSFSRSDNLKAHILSKHSDVPVDVHNIS